MKTHLSSAFSYRPTRWTWIAKALAACAVTSSALYAPTAAAGGIQQCSASVIQPVGGWSIKQDFASVQNNDSVAEITIAQTITAKDTGPGYLMGVSTLATGVESTYNTFPLITFPGLGLKWSWAGYENVSNAPLSGAAPTIGKTVTGFATDWISVPFGGTFGTKTYKNLWKVQLIVTNVKAYAGGVGDFSRETGLAVLQLIPTVMDNLSNPNRQSCSPVLSGIQQALSKGGVIALPELPKPPTPTCQFPTLLSTQTITLNTGSTGSIPAQGAARSAGASSETLFNLNAVNCGANSNYSIYFTDANVPGQPKDFLTTTGQLAGKVNVRLYSGNNTAPVQYGPAPSGSVLPSYAPGVSNSLTPAGSSFSHPFYAQYVRANGVSASDLAAGTLSAKTTVTVVYP